MMTEQQKPTRPPGLGTAGGRFWRQITSDFALNTAEMALLEHVCRTIDVLARLDDALADAPLTVRGSQGQERENPLLSEARLQRSSLAQLLRQLALPDTEELAEVREVLSSRRHRDSARARWSS